jgi:small subunit ribosomal protein S20
MPIIKSAIKKLRKDKKRTAQNKAIKRKFKALVKKALAEATLENINLAISAIDKAVKKKVIHKNKAARIKSKVMKAATKEEKRKKGTTETLKKKEAQSKRETRKRKKSAKSKKTSTKSAEKKKSTDTAN